MGSVLVDLISLGSGGCIVRTSSTVEPTTIIFTPFDTLASRRVRSSFNRPLYISFIIAGGIPGEGGEGGGGAGIIRALCEMC